MPLNANGEIIGVLVVGFTKPYEWLPTEREMSVPSRPLRTGYRPAAA